MLASVYALRLFIRAMHNRVGPKVDSREITMRDGIVLAPLLAVILFMALYPQLALHRSEGSVKAAVASAHADATPAVERVAATRASRSHAVAAQAQARAPSESCRPGAGGARCVGTYRGALK